MTTFPPELVPWAPLLSELTASIALPIGHMARKLDAAIGPLRPRIPLPGGEPDGYRGLSRRGPYDRLLLSEWALLDEAPDEFVRRASEREHAFLQLDHRSPRQGIRCEAVFDAGPESLGSPRIAHIALLLVLARRAEIAGAEFAWSVAQRPGPVHVGVNGPSLRALLDGRSGHPFVAPEAGPAKADERWFVGGSSVRGYKGVIAAVVTDVMIPDTDEVCVSVERPGRTPATIHLTLPLADSRRQLILDPTARGRPSRSVSGHAIGAAEWRTFPKDVRAPVDVRFIYGTQQFAATFDSGHVLVWSLSNIETRKVPKAQIERGVSPPHLVALGYSHQRPLSVLRRIDNTVLVCGQRSFASAQSVHMPTAGHGSVIALASDQGTHDRRLFTDGNSRLWSLYRGKGETEYRLTDEQLAAEDLVATNQGGWVLGFRVVAGESRHSLRLIRADGSALAELPIPEVTWGKFTHGHHSDHQYVGVVTLEGEFAVGRSVGVMWQVGSPSHALRFHERGRVPRPEGQWVGACVAWINPEQQTEVAAVAYDTTKGVFRRAPDGAHFSVPREPLGACLSFDGKLIGFYTAEGTVELWSFTTGGPVMLRAEAP